MRAGKGGEVDQLIEIEGVRVLVFARQGSLLQCGGDANDFLSAAWSQRADFLAIPSGRLGTDFLKLSTRVAGEVFQKFVTYRLRCAIVGDVSEALESSQALRDFVRETNKGNSVWFVADIDELKAKLFTAEACRPEG
jgi:Domain of unknown function (DUF4180)